MPETTQMEDVDMAINTWMIVSRVVSALAAKDYPVFIRVFRTITKNSPPRNKLRLYSKASILTQMFASINQNEQLLSESM